MLNRREAIGRGFASLVALALWRFVPAQNHILTRWRVGCVGEWKRFTDAVAPETGNEDVAVGVSNRLHAIEPAEGHTIFRVWDIGTADEPASRDECANAFALLGGFGTESFTVIGERDSARIIGRGRYYEIDLGPNDSLVVYPRSDQHPLAEAQAIEIARYLRPAIRTQNAYYDIVTNGLIELHPLSGAGYLLNAEIRGPAMKDASEPVFAFQEGRSLRISTQFSYADSLIAPH